MQFNLYLYLYILYTAKKELHMIKTTGVMFVGRADQARRRMLPITITDDVLGGVGQLTSL
jgi:hypothetical protein